MYSITICRQGVLRAVFPSNFGSLAGSPSRKFFARYGTLNVNAVCTPQELYFSFSGDRVSKSFYAREVSYFTTISWNRRLHPPLPVIIARTTVVHVSVSSPKVAYS